MSEVFNDLYDIVERRKAEREDGSYTAYLFDAGLDKILKKVGEETAETIIAAKNLVSDMDSKEGEAEREALKNEVADLLYHLVVLLSKLGVWPDEIENLLRERMKTEGNLKESLK